MSKEDGSSSNGNDAGITLFPDDMDFPAVESILPSGEEVFFEYVSTLY